MSATTMTTNRSGKGGTTLVKRPARSGKPAGAASSAPARRPGEAFDLAAWVHGIAPLVEDLPTDLPADQPMVRVPAEPVVRAPVRAPAPSAPSARAEEPAPAPRPAARRDRFDLAAWVFGVARQVEPTPATPTKLAGLRRGPSAPPARKPVTLPDLFEGAAVPPCLRDD